MATKSILKHISIKDRKNASAFILALENAKGKKSVNIIPSKKSIDANEEQIRNLFGAQ